MPSSIALIPIDVQRGFDYPPWGRRNNPHMERNGQRLLAAWRERGWPLIHVRHDSMQAGSTLRPDHPGNAFRDGFEPRAGEALVSKSVNSAFIGTDLDLRLRRLGVDTVIVFGVSTDMCVSTTARMASNLGYRTIVVADACFCFDLDDGAGGTLAAEAISAAHLATLRAEFAQVMDTSELLAALDEL
ncbi:cysteine hydrolase family protein [Lysobacter enzymogenes]|uniref:Isochorismatase hydrolase n=1 Tax=Lysobacter enzymogenes TaxID=69 RepID=A0AAU9AHZ1_LYSEN|nr:cysteine hydrolase family protein [Lysobacter enzymogenes]BAV96068.1 isochorismatase hydrolase [Lysobacter enzymogenes]